MSTEFQQVDKRFSDALAEIVRLMPVEGLTLRELLHRLGARGLLMLCMVLTVPFLLPISIPGLSIPFGLVIALSGVGIVTRSAPWLPDRLMNRRLASEQLIVILGKGIGLFARLERLTRHRLLPLTHGATMGRFNGILLMLSGILLMSPLPLPFSNTLPAYGALFLAAGSLEFDGYVVLAGYMMLLLTISYFGVVAVLGKLGAQALLIYL